MAYKAIDIAKKMIDFASKQNFTEEISNLRLQKMLYYQQGYHLAAFGTPLFDDPIEAWQYGPVVPSVYDVFRKYGASSIPVEEGDPFPLKKEEDELFADVWEAYRDFSAIGLMNQTHKERPWIETRRTNANSVISTDLMKDFFKRLYDEQG